MIISHLIAGLLGTWIIGTTSVVGFYSPQHVMVDVTNDFGVCVLQMISTKKENIAFSPYGLVSVALVLYEGSTGPSAAEIHNTLRLPWDREVTRVGFRDMHRYLKSYFSNDGFLRGLVLSKPNIGLRTNYTDLLQFYGFDVRTAPPKTPGTTTLAVTTTARPFTTLSIPTTKRPTTITTTVPGKTTTTAAPETTDLDARFGTTTTETSLKQTVQTVMNAKTETPPTFRTTAERSTSAITTTRSPPPITTLISTTQTLPTTTQPPTTMLPSTTTTKTPPTTTQGTTTLPPQTTPRITTNLSQTTLLVGEATITLPPATSNASTPSGTTTKLPDSTQAGTTLDIVTMTDKKPNLPEIMSQINISAVTTAPAPEQGIQGREGDAEMDLPTTTTLPVTSTNLVTGFQTTTFPLPDSTLAKEPQITTQPSVTTTIQTINTVEVSVAETTIVKSVTMVNPNTTPTTLPLVEVTNPPTSIQRETPTPVPKLETGAVTLEIETTTRSPQESSTEVATESMIDQGTSDLDPDPTTIIPSVEQNSTTEVNPTEARQDLQTTSENINPTEGTDIQIPTTELQPIATEVEPELATQSSPVVTSLPPSFAPLPALALEEMLDSATSETGVAAALTRQQRSLPSTHRTPEQHQSGSNWVPQYYDQRWGRNPSNEFWFFTFNGGENVPAHTYTAYLPFAFVPELSSLALQLPLDDPRYFILILLPEERLGLSQLLYALQWCPVRSIVSRLKMTAVYAVVPAFTIVKHINLVPALAQMGIHSVFDPFRADMNPMTSEPHVFVRTIEQVVTVSLRKYYTSNRWFEALPSEVQQHFVANHPFAYFVLDKETGVTLMTGTIVNPIAHNQ